MKLKFLIQGGYAEPPLFVNCEILYVSSFNAFAANNHVVVTLPYKLTRQFCMSAHHYLLGEFIILARDDASQCLLDYAN